VNDASRCVPVAGALISKELRTEFASQVTTEYERLREHHKNARSQQVIVPLEVARKNKQAIDWSKHEFVKPAFTGTKKFTAFPLNEIAEFIDWTPFFHSWEMKGIYPAILTDPERGTEASKLFNDAQKMLKKIIDEKWLQANAVIGIYPANTVNDDSIIVYTDDSRSEKLTSFESIRQQTRKPEGHFNIAMSDFIAPAPYADYIGTFAVTTGIGIDEHVAAFEKDHDDYSAIMLKALADRLAEAFAELMHLKVRKEFWGYAAKENLSKEELIKEVYHGIRPAPGYPAQPDHTEKITLFKLMDVEKNAGITLTSGLAMVPTAAVSGLYFSHPESHYFGVGKIGRDQVTDYAKRKGMSFEEAEKWLGTVLGY
jgi:5-methyltetrahydrofolate--homocysteine methyltransferase